MKQNIITQIVDVLPLIWPIPLLACAGAVVLAPFPYWRTYVLLWRSLVRSSSPWRMRVRQGKFLLEVGLTAPVRTFLWYLDELLYPDYRTRQVHPIFIIGQPRCGTTLLHRTIAADTRTFFAVRHLEWRYPFIIVQKAIQTLHLEDWLGKQSYWPETDEGRLAAKMHSNRLSDWEEDGIFFEETFLHHFFIFLRFPDPALLAYLDSFSDLPADTRRRILDVHERVIQKVQYLRGPESRFYLSKEVTSHDKIPSLLSRYADGRYIVIARKANHFMASLQALMQTSTHVKTAVDPRFIPQWQEVFINRMRKDSVLLANLCRHTIPAERQIRVSAEHFMQDIESTVRTAYAKLQLTMSAEFAAHLDQIGRDTKNRDRGYTYDDIRLEGFEEYDAFVDEIVSQQHARPKHDVFAHCARTENQLQGAPT